MKSPSDDFTSLRQELHTVIISIHVLAIETFAPMLTTLSALLEKGAEDARAKACRVRGRQRRREQSW